MVLKTCQTALSVLTDWLEVYLVQKNFLLYFIIGVIFPLFIKTILHSYPHVHELISSKPK